MPIYTVVDDADDPGPIQHPAITLVDPDGGPYNPATAIPSGTYPQNPASPTPAVAVLTTTDQSIAGNKTYTGVPKVAPTGLAGYFTPFESVVSNPPGIKGPTVQRSSAGGATGLSFYTGTTYEWGLGFDLNLGGSGGSAGPNLADFVLLNQRLPGGGSADILRVREGMFFALGNTATPDTAVRLKIASNGTYSSSEVSTLREMLRLEIGDAASGITHLIRGVTPGSVFGVLKNGWVAAGTNTPLAPIHVYDPGPAGASVGDGVRVQLSGSNDPGFFAWTQGTSTADWRVGRTTDGNVDLQFLRPDGSVATPASPGVQAMLFKRNGDIYINRSLIVRSDAIGTLPLIVRGFAGQTNSLLSFETSVGGALSRFDATGRLIFNRTAAGVAIVDIVAAATTDVPLIVSGFSASQSADLFNARTTPTGSAVAFIKSDGRAGFGTSAPFGNATISAQLQTSLAYPIVVLRRVASQTSDFLTIQDESQVTLSRIGKGGRWVIKTPTAPILADLVDGETALSNDASGNLIVTSRVSGALKTATVTVA